MAREHRATSWFLGVDPGSHRAAACLLSDADQTHVCAFELAKGDLAARLCQLDHDLTVWLCEQCGLGRSATCTVVENPGVGRTSNLSTVASFGVCLATVYAVMPCPTFELLNNQWRAKTPLGGRAGKEAVVAWALQNGVEGEDEAMAFGCSWAARELHRAANRSAA